MSRLSMGFAGLMLLASAVGCDDKKATQLAPAASSLATTAPPPAAMTMKFVIDPASKTTLELDAPKENIKASTTAADGSLDIDLMNVINSRGEVKVDLSTIKTTTFPDAAKNDSQTTHARTWLEVGDGESGKLDDATKATNRWAVYAIRSVDSASAPDVTKVAAAPENGEDVRTVTMTTKGEILIHGHKVDRDADLEVKFHYPTGGDAAKPTAITVKTRKPFRIVLAEHDVKPRDGFGKIAKGSFNLLGTKVADNADISLDFRATPKP